MGGADFQAQVVPDVLLRALLQVFNPLLKMQKNGDAETLDSGLQEKIDRNNIKKG